MTMGSIFKGWKIPMIDISEYDAQEIRGQFTDLILSFAGRKFRALNRRTVNVPPSGAANRRRLIQLKMGEFGWPAGQYSARSIPRCSCSTIWRPISQ